jgi:hypothetical protein
MLSALVRSSLQQKKTRATQAVCSLCPSSSWLVPLLNKWQDNLLVQSIIYRVTQTSIVLIWMRGRKADNTIDSVSKHCNSQLPSLALSNPASPENKPRAATVQYHGVMFEDLPSEAACCGEQTRALTVSAANSPLATPSIASSKDASTDREDNNIAVLPRLNLLRESNSGQTCLPAVYFALE